MIDVPHDPALENRAAVWQNANIGLPDVLHLASAETGGADVFATADDELLQRAARGGQMEQAPPSFALNDSRLASSHLSG